MGEGVDAGLGRQLAAELERAGAMIEELAVRLCLDPVVFERHAEPLQRFDHVTQIIGEIARILQCRGTQDDALTAVRLDAMRERLTDAR